MEKTDNGFFSSIIKGSLISVILTLFLILVFGFIIKTASVTDNLITPVNQFIKIAAVFSGCFFSLKGKAGFLKGGVLGLLFSVILYALFFMISGKISVDAKTVVDIIFTVLIGMISGIITVNVKKE